MFGRKKTEATPESKIEEAAPKSCKGYTPKKTTPTPSRKKANAANRRPTVANRKTISRGERRELERERSEANTARWNRQQETMYAGDERNMPP